MNKTCPNCQKDIPEFVTRCKHCFYEYPQPKSPRQFPVYFALLFFILSLGASYTLKNQSQQNSLPVAGKDMPNKQLVILEKKENAFKTKVIPFSEIEKIEYEDASRINKYHIYAVTKTDRFQIAAEVNEYERDQHAKDFDKDLVKVNASGRK